MNEDNTTPNAGANLALFRLVTEEAQALNAAYPGYYAADTLSAERVIELASERLRARGVLPASDVDWTREHLDAVTMRVLAKECLLHRLVATLNSRGDIDKAVAYGRRRGCDEYEALDAVEDAIVGLVQRGHGMQSEDTLLRFFRTIVWEKVSDALEARARRRKIVKEASAEEIDVEARDAISPIDVMSCQEARDILVSSLVGAAIPFNRKAALLLKYGAGWSSSAIAELLGVSESQVDVMNFRSKKALRTSLDRDAVSSSARSGISRSRAVAVEAAAERLAEVGEKAGLLLHGLFDMPVGEVAALCAVPQARLLELVAQAEGGSV